MTNKKTMVVLISGRMVAGKSTLADLLVNHFLDMGFNTEKFLFAGSLKLIAKRVFGWDGEKDEKGRTFLQELGSTVRNYNEDYWAKTTLSMIENSKKYPFDIIVIDDWRYPNEYNVINSSLLNIVYRVRISSDREIINYHTSETSLTNSDYYDALVGNSGTISELSDTAMQLCKYLLELHKKRELEIQK